MPADFPEPQGPVHWALPPRQRTIQHGSNSKACSATWRRIPPAIAGEHATCIHSACVGRLVRGFALDDDEALTLLASWNLRCIPPWSERDSKTSWLEGAPVRARANRSLSAH